MTAATHTKCERLTKIGHPGHPYDGNYVFPDGAPSQAVIDVMALIPEDHDMFITLDLETVSGLKATLSAGEWDALVAYQKEEVDKKRLEFAGDGPGGLHHLWIALALCLSGGNTPNPAQMADWVNAFDALAVAYPYPTEE